MRELTTVEIEQAGGGVIGVLGALAIGFFWEPGRFVCLRKGRRCSRDRESGI